jgi:hypothetical protein
MDLDGLNRVGSGLDVRILDQDTDFRFDNTKMHRNQEGAKHLGQPLLKCLNKLTVWYTQLPTTEYSAKQIVVDLRCIQSRGIARESYNIIAEQCNINEAAMAIFKYYGFYLYFAGERILANG